MVIKEEHYYFGDYEVYRKFENNMLKTERTTVNVSDDKKKIVTIDKLTVDQGSLTTNPMPIIRYQYDNHLGSASLELDETSDIISYEEYHPFGTTSYRSGRTETETSQKRYKYVGKERDEETGLYYYGARYYAAWICRFVSVDPLKEERTWLNPYNYVQNNPINKIDPDGKLDDDPPQSTEGKKSPTLNSQSYTINQDENGKVTSVSITYKKDVVYNVNGEIISGQIQTEEFNDIIGLMGSDKYANLMDQLKLELDTQLEELNPNKSTNQETLFNVDNNSIITSNMIEGQTIYLSSPNQSAPVDKASQGLTMAGISSDVGQYSSKATWGKYKKSNGQIKKIETLKHSKGIKYSKQGSVKSWGATKKLSKHAQKAIKSAKFFKTMGNILGPASIALDWADVIWGDQDPINAAINTSFTALAMFGGPVGAAISAVYFIGTMVPGGWEGIFDKMRNTIMQIHNLHSRDGIMTAPWLYGK